MKTIIAYFLVVGWIGIVGFGNTGCDRTKTPTTVPKTSTESSKKQVRIAAAADLKFAMEHMKERFNLDHPDIQVSVTYGSSGSFYSQLQNRAPYDLFLSADMEYPRRLVETGQAFPETLFEYALGRIVVWVRNDSPLRSHSDGMTALVDPQTTRIAIANPKHAPYGRAAEEALKSVGIYGRVKDRFVYGENIAQTTVFVESGNAQIGIVALSLAMAPGLREKGHFWPVPEESYPPIRQGGVILKSAQDFDAAESFRQFMIGPNGREILINYGFGMPDHN